MSKSFSQSRITQCCIYPLWFFSKIWHLYVLLSNHHNLIYFSWSNRSGSRLKAKPRVNSARLSLLPTPCGIYRAAQGSPRGYHQDLRSTHSLIGAKCCIEAAGVSCCKIKQQETLRSITQQQPNNRFPSITFLYRERGCSTLARSLLVW